MAAHMEFLLFHDVIQGKNKKEIKGKRKKRKQFLYSSMVASPVSTIAFIHHLLFYTPYKIHHISIVNVRRLIPGWLKQNTVK